MKRKILIGLGVLLILAIGGMFWYSYTYSMSEVESFESGPRQSDEKVLIATQGSAYKNNLVDRLIDFLVSHEVYVNVIDVSLLDSVNSTNWDAIVVLHTWEKWEPQENAAQFLEKQYDPEKVFVVTTSGGGDEKIKGVDAITGASILAEIPDHLTQLKQKLSVALNLGTITKVQ